MTITKLRFHIPSLRNQADIQQIQEVLRNSPGFDHAEVDYVGQTVEAVTANQDRGMDVIDRLTRAGFHPDDMRVMKDGDRPG